jgi:hypothetical protein
MRPDNRHRRLRQHVLVLGSGSPPGQPRCRSASVDVRHTDHDDVELRYRVHLLRNASAEALLAHPVTAVFAPLARCPPGQRIDLVRRAAAAIGAARSAGLDQRDVVRLANALRGFAGFRIPLADIIDQAVHEELQMPIEWKKSSTIGPLLLAAEAEGEAKGEARGQARGRILGMLEALFGPDERIDADLADRLGALPDAERRIRQAASLDQLLS